MKKMLCLVALLATFCSVSCFVAGSESATQAEASYEEEMARIQKDGDYIRGIVSDIDKLASSENRTEDETLELKGKIAQYNAYLETGRVLPLNFSAVFNYQFNSANYAVFTFKPQNESSLVFLVLDDSTGNMQNMVLSVVSAAIKLGFADFNIASTVDGEPLAIFMKNGKAATYSILPDGFDFASVDQSIVDQQVESILSDVIAQYAITP